MNDQLLTLRGREFLDRVNKPHRHITQKLRHIVCIWRRQYRTTRIHRRHRHFSIQDVPRLLLSFELQDALLQFPSHHCTGIQTSPYPLILTLLPAFPMKIEASAISGFACCDGAKSLAPRNQQTGIHTPYRLITTKNRQDMRYPHILFINSLHIARDATLP